MRSPSSPRDPTHKKKKTTPPPSGSAAGRVCSSSGIATCPKTTNAWIASAAPCSSAARWSSGSTRTRSATHRGSTLRIMMHHRLSRGRCPRMKGKARFADSLLRTRICVGGAPQCGGEMALCAARAVVRDVEGDSGGLSWLNKQPPICSCHDPRKSYS
ncbi:hypothetical protein BO86DRAFT_91852 [Aspergillus japonicus CBS 114.51]|uniref:Uncharacterized protein n=1 Tax=Aspergillus japonicus CBS 114.51 TaxID=1448312 RepID=A0A8T8X0T8_ASPJA|nr:hypothetical protein BO86DRAFT_91852 [Aspergillus japonicus CBS 114.51]RAH81713.1 hypothetical protein BO86DRAFT_91852 [Aspergillus japonicus CBS 114.51]